MRTVRADAPVDLLRELTPQVLGALVRRYGHFETAEDAVQEALLVAAERWPREGVPADPRSWLVRVASRRLIDLLRAEQARRDREAREATALPLDRAYAPAADTGPPVDDSLLLLFLCCHPALPVPAQVALTLRAVGGLSTAEIARAFLVPEPTMAQRISRAKSRIRASGLGFRTPPPREAAARSGAVLQVLYLIFNEGYTGAGRPELCTEAIRLARLAHRLLPDDGEVTGLLALMLLTDARRAARSAPDGTLVPLAEQDRRRWDRAAIDEGVALLTHAMSGSRPGPYQLQAAIAAVHSEAADLDDTDWPQILGLYHLLEALTGNPVVALNRVVAEAMVRGPRIGLARLAELATDDRLRRHHRLDAVRAHLLDLAGDAEAARAAYLAAARGATSAPEQRYLRARASAPRPAAAMPRLGG
ncbi:RNA polymerase sigma factor [Micromonospora sp. NPDC000089]|uniref:RNA polymerase sigma factor n=1 Tax=unclassified Micromonospora TaxID=2617518 RepID=UPI003697BA7D